MRAVCAALAILTLGCAGVVPSVAPVPAHPLPVGINDGFHGVLPPERFAADCPHMIRTPQLSGAALHAFLMAAKGCPVLALVEAPDVELVTAFAKESPDAIELGNELELAPYELTPDQYASWIFKAATALDSANYTGAVVIGGVYAITPETKRALSQGLAACLFYPALHCVVGVHLYNASDEDLAYLRRFKDPIWVTEVGAHDNCDPAKIAEKQPWLASQIARFSTVPTLERVFIYQRLRGSDCSDLSTFGIDGQSADTAFFAH